MGLEMGEVFPCDGRGGALLKLLDGGGGAVLVRRLEVCMVGVWQEEYPRNVVEVVIYPSPHLQPFRFPHRDCDRGFVLTPVLPVGVPEGELLIAVVLARQVACGGAVIGKENTVAVSGRVTSGSWGIP